MTERNWSGTLEYRAREVVTACTVEEVRAALAGSGPVRVLGTRHSFSSIADTDGTLIEVTGLPFEPELDPVARQVRCGAGTRYAVLARFLEQHGWALANMGSLPHISVGGATATGTHGSGNRLQNLSSSVRWLEILTADGSLESIGADDPRLPGAVVGLGALGVVTRIGLAIEPSYQVRQEVYGGLRWDDLLADPDTIFGAGYSVSVFTDWLGPSVQEVLVKFRLAPEDPTEPPEELLGARRLGQAELEQRRLLEGADNWTERGTPGPWCERLPHFRIEATPSLGDELQTEYFVPRAAAGQALAAIRGIGAELAGPLLITELRTVAADDLWLSPGHQRDSLGIHFTWYSQPDAVAARLPLIEATLAPFAARPHWGKVFQLDTFDVDAHYPRAADFRGLAEDLDPQGRFRNDYLRRTLWA